METAQRGDGIMLGRRPFIDRLLHVGELMEVFSEPLHLHAVYYLRHRHGWGIASRTGADGCAVYWLPADEIARLRGEGVAA
ncbi:MAG TPA: hypothetical protein EYP90_10290 [Chromatiaceae bacterium]|nr:hypothetical protein [Chromatiaceae bacterium]